MTVDQLPVEVRDAVADLAASWLPTLPGRDRITAESVGAEIRRRFDLVPGSWRGDAVVAYAVDRLEGTYDELR